MFPDNVRNALLLFILQGLLVSRQPTVLEDAQASSPALREISGTACLRTEVTLNKGKPIDRLISEIGQKWCCTALFQGCVDVPTGLAGVPQDD